MSGWQIVGDSIITIRERFGLAPIAELNVASPVRHLSQGASPP